MSASSTLEKPSQRFLSLVLQHSLANDWLTAQDFSRTFSVETLVLALEAAPALRARLLTEAAGVHERIAPKKSNAAATEDLEIALSEGVATPALLLELVDVDDRVRYFSTETLWSMVAESEFWKEATERSKARMLAVLSTALDLDLVSLKELIVAVTPARLAAALPRDALELALVRAVECGQLETAFGADHVFETLPLDQWTAHVPLPWLWESVVENLIAAPQGLVKAKAKETVSSTPEARAAAPTSQPIHPPGELEARQRALTNLKRIERVPVRPDELPTPVLLAIDAMYEELTSIADEEDRAQCIRDAFPNRVMLEEALFAMAETLDARLTPEVLRSRGAEGESLITLVLFEERRRANGRGDGAGSLSRPPGPVTMSPVAPPVVERPSSEPPPASTTAVASGRRGSVAPPPLPGEGAPRRSVPPPPLPVQAQRK